MNVKWNDIAPPWLVFRLYLVLLSTSFSYFEDNIL